MGETLAPSTCLQVDRTQFFALPTKKWSICIAIFSSFDPLHMRNDFPPLFESKSPRLCLGCVWVSFAVITNFKISGTYIKGVLPSNISGPTMALSRWQLLPHKSSHSSMQAGRSKLIEHPVFIVKGKNRSWWCMSRPLIYYRPKHVRDPSPVTGIRMYNCLKGKRDNNTIRIIIGSLLFPHEASSINDHFSLLYLQTLYSPTTLPLYGSKLSRLH